MSIPDFYRPPLCLPLNWRDEVSGVLPRAVEAYLDNRVKGTPITEEQTRILCEYIVHYISAPCWDDPSGVFKHELTKLRASAKELKTADDISAWIYEAMEIGLDPL